MPSANSALAAFNRRLSSLRPRVGGPARRRSDSRRIWSGLIGTARNCANTVYVYVTHLRDKLRVPDLHTVLAQLRAVPIRPDHIRLESERRLDGQHTRGRKLDSHRLNAAKALLA